jgi:hypothetical protein
MLVRENKSFDIFILWTILRVWIIFPFSFHSVTIIRISNPSRKSLTADLTYFPKNLPYFNVQCFDYFPKIGIETIIFSIIENGGVKSQP